MPVRTPSRRRAAAAPAQRPRLIDVAEAAGVSTMTVVRVLRDPAKVAADTRARVERVLRKTGYTPDLVARGLASKRSGLIGAVVPLLTNSLIAEIMQGLSDAIAVDGLHLVLGASGFSSAEEEALVRAFLSRRVDALYLTGGIHTPATVRMLKQAAIPVVEGGNLGTRPIDMMVGYSNVDAGREVTRYLLARSYAPVGYIGAHPTDNDRARDRRRGYELALRDAGVRPERTLCVETTLDIDAGAHAMGALLERRPDVRGVFCSADAMAVGALFECQRRGLSIPSRIAIAGFDDVPIARQVVPALTTLRVPRYEIGQRAGEMIRARLAKVAIAQAVVDTGFEFVPRDSA
ncbi:MAG TPA: LacI family DNA-binding transcriptional regulator [Casimicrobiaceae bacterium]|jgi:LacI family transcriptional regulator, gluconate utilization system Gnt-I transcriptional repressor|nr:LacI family DNA-binding transcriptional regulator [Casimicrobiaceae bacterium]